MKVTSLRLPGVKAWWLFPLLPRRGHINDLSKKALESNTQAPFVVAKQCIIMYNNGKYYMEGYYVRRTN